MYYSNQLRKMAAFSFFSASVLIAVWPDAATAQDSENWAHSFVAARVAARTLQSIPVGTRGGRMDVTRNLMEGRIVGGNDAAANENPFQVALLLSDIDNNSSAQFCGGSLVTSTVIVTAAHCSDFISADKVQVLTGTRRLDGGGTRRNVSRIAIHPGWDSSTFDNDVAVWKMSTAENNQSTASLATSDGNVGEDLLVTGWGRLTEAGSASNALQAVEVPLVSRSNCNDSNSYNGDITTTMLCAGLDQGGRDSCQGDSGGPLTRGANSGQLAGIVSWGVGCARANLYGVYARVSHRPIRQFLQEEIGEDLSEDCNSFNPRNLRVSRINGDTKIVEGSHWLYSFGDKTDAANRALSIIQAYGANRSCFVGRPNPEMTYILVGNSAPAGAQPGEDCISFNPSNLSIRNSGGKFVLTSSRSSMIAFDRQIEAQTAISIIRAKGFTRQCFQGRPRPPFKYFRR